MRKIGAIFLVSCTTIGAGILALPTNTYAGGFFPSTLVFLICWFFMTVGALLILESSLWYRRETNLISMAADTLGSLGKSFTWVVYIILLYALISAYLTGGGAWLATLIEKFLNVSVSISAGAILLAICTGALIILGTGIVDQFNRLLAIGLFVSFFLLIAISIPKVNPSYIDWKDLSALSKTVPLLLTTFGFAIIVPTLVHYLNRDQSSLLQVIWIGSGIPLVLYIIWEFTIFGILSIEGPHGLQELVLEQANGTQVVSALASVLHTPSLTVSASAFAIFALLTSLIGVALSLFHFLADGLHRSQKGKDALFLFALTFLPPIFLILFFPAGFDVILSFGGIFVALLLGILPVLIVWFGRYHTGMGPSGFRVFGGKPLLLLTAGFFTWSLFQEIRNLF